MERKKVKSKKRYKDDKMTISTRVEPELYETVKQFSSEDNVTLSEFTALALECYLYYLTDAMEDFESEHKYDNLTFDELSEMSFAELEDIVNDLELGIDVSEYKGFFSSDTEGLCNAIADELELDDDSDDDSDDSDDSDDDSDDSDDSDDDSDGK